MFFSWWGFLYFYYCIWSGYLQVEMLIKLNIKINYDRIVAFMNGKDPNEVNVSKRRAVITDIIIFILVSGGYGVIGMLSIYLAFKFL